MLFDTRGGMVSLDDRYYGINRKLLMIIGLWPYQKLRFRIVPITLCLFLLFSLFTVELSTFITSEVTMNLVLEVLSQACPCLIYIIMYITFLIKTKTVKSLFEQIHNEWMTIKASDEIDILKKYAGISRLLLLFGTGAVICGAILFALPQFLPDFLDIVAPLNESRERHLPYVAEYFIDHRRYFHPIMMHGILAIDVGCLGVVATGGVHTTYVLHICAMLKIASYRLEHINDNVPINVDVRTSSFGEDHVVCERIVNAVVIHQRALEYSDFLMSYFTFFYFVLTGVITVTLTVNMFQFLNCVMFTNNMNGALASILLVLSFVIVLFVGTSSGQAITDHNNDIFNNTYATQWYALSVRAQKMLLLILQKNTKDFYFTLGGFVVSSLQSFASITSMSVSYFTMIYSMR